MIKLCGSVGVGCHIVPCLDHRTSFIQSSIVFRGCLRQQPTHALVLALAGDPWPPVIPLSAAEHVLNERELQVRSLRRLESAEGLCKAYKRVA